MLGKQIFLQFTDVVIVKHKKTQIIDTFSCLIINIIAVLSDSKKVNMIIHRKKVIVTSISDILKQEENISYNYHLSMA